jgi:hypothetical protein
VNKSTRTILPALLAVSGGIASAPATALELGEINVQSTIGQPLRASIAFALAPNEQIADYCVALSPGAAASGMPSISQATISVANGVISLKGDTAIREPLMTTRLNVTCPYTPKLSREYMLFIDPARPAEQLVVQPQSSIQPATSNSPAATTNAVTPSANRVSPRRAAAISSPIGSPIDGSVRYRVQPADSLSEIAQRIENRPVGLWSAVAQIFDANPNAFLDADPNRLKAGSWLTIPDFGPDALFVQNTTPVEPVAVAVDAASANTAIQSIVAVETIAVESAPADTPVVDIAAAITNTSVDESFVDDTGVLEPAASPISQLQPGDIILDTDLAAPTTATSPNVPVANILTNNDSVPASTNWLIWLVGSGIALIAGLLMFGRRNRQSPAPIPAESSAERRKRRSTDSGITEELNAVANVDFDIADDSPTHENLVLDADLEIGTGLDKGTEVDVAQDFGFAVTTHLDLELPDESAAVPDQPETDIIAAPSIARESILESEILPDDDDYDMSVIMDATKIPLPEEVTERDLKAIFVNNDDETLISGDYTVSKEVDYDILEQDYQDEMTATQVLNMEIEKAVAERVEEDAIELTSEMPLATVTHIDKTANLPIGNEDEHADLDDTGVNPEFTEEMLADEKTVEMPAPKDDETVEMTVESGEVDTKAG